MLISSLYFYDVVLLLNILYLKLSHGDPLYINNNAYR
jgi:hypothetical protein